MTENTIKTTSTDISDFSLSKNMEDNTMQNEQIKNLSLLKLAAFENHPFRVTQDADFQKLVDSIKGNGVLIPAIARPKGDGYELIAGHRRKFACQIIGIEEMPVLVRELTDEQAIIAMVDSNVQRENILPSEKAFAYKMKLEAVKRLPGRPRNNSSQVGTNFRADVLVAENTGESRNQIQRYIRLTELIPQLLQMVDDKKIAFNPAVELSYLSKEQQKMLLSAMDAEQSSPSLSQAQKLKVLSGQEKLDEDAIMEVMCEPKANQKEQVRIPYEKVKSILKKDMQPKELEDFILKAVTRYQAYLNKQKTEQTR